MCDCHPSSQYQGPWNLARVSVLCQATIFLKWVRFATDIVLNNRTFVIINMDETSLSNVDVQSPGLRCRCQPHERRVRRAFDATDRTDVKTVLLASVCDSANLQPLLPQVVLPKYTKGCRPPQHVLEKCAATGQPIEYWHGSGGYATIDIIKRWAKKVRSVVHSFNPDAWILLIWDCSAIHLSVDLAQYLKRLGILVIFVPAKLTWMLQVCDVYVFHELKTRLRMHKSFLRMTSSRGRLEVGDWITCCGAAVRDVIVNRSYEEAFDKMGLGGDISLMAGRARRGVHPDLVHPALPTRAEFAQLTNRQQDTAGFRLLHKITVGHMIEVHERHPDVPPPQGAHIMLADVAPAKKKQRHEAGVAWDEAIENHLMASSSVAFALPQGRAQAINHHLPRAPAL